uniref:CCHC-type domain-containing protein n=1 Tax=Ditylenchus dipsaci TaxID=166011 RepID=A0A915D0U8_9BILA
MGPLRNISGLFSVLSANKHNLLLLISVALTMPISAASQLITNTSLAAEGYCGNNTVAVRRTLEHLHETHIQPLVEWSQKANNDVCNSWAVESGLATETPVHGSKFSKNDAVLPVNFDTYKPEASSHVDAHGPPKSASNYHDRVETTRWVPNHAGLPDSQGCRLIHVSTSEPPGRAQDHVGAPEPPGWVPKHQQETTAVRRLNMSLGNAEFNVAHAISSASPEYKPRNRDYPANSSRDSSPASNKPQPSQWEGDPEPYPVQQPVYLVPPDIDHDYRQSRDYGRNPDRNIQCYYCRAFGHKVDRCPRKSNHPVSQYQRRQYNDYRQSANFPEQTDQIILCLNPDLTRIFGSRLVTAPVIKCFMMNEFGDPVYQTNVLIDPDLSRTSVHDPAEVIPQNSPANVDYPAQSADIHNPVEMISHKHPVKSPDQRKIQIHAEDEESKLQWRIVDVYVPPELFEPETPVNFDSPSEEG